MARCRAAGGHARTSEERHWGKQVWVSRKGAIEAQEGQPGLIPGSMGTASYEGD